MYKGANKLRYVFRTSSTMMDYKAPPVELKDIPAPRL